MEMHVINSWVSCFKAKGYHCMTPCHHECPGDHVLLYELSDCLTAAELQEVHLLGNEVIAVQVDHGVVPNDGAQVLEMSVDSLCCCIGNCQIVDLISVTPGWNACVM